MPSRMSMWVMAAACVAGAIGIGLALAEVDSWVRTGCVLIFLAIAPTLAIAGLLRRFDGFSRIVVAGAADIALLSLISFVMLAEGAWSPVRGLLAVAAITLICLAGQLGPVRRAASARALSWQRAVQHRLALTNGHDLGTRDGWLERILPGKNPRAKPVKNHKATTTGDLGRTSLWWVPADVEAAAQDGARPAGRIEDEREVAERGGGEPLQFSEPQSWSPVQPEVIGQVFHGEVEPIEPSVFVRDDNVALLYPGRLNLFVGPTESCKSWASLMAVAQEIRKGNVACVVDFEDSTLATVERLRQLGLTEEHITTGVAYCSPTTPFDAAAQARLQTHLRYLCHKPHRNLTLAIVDSVNQAMEIEGLNPEVERHAARFCAGLPRWLKNQGAAVVLIEGLTKATGLRGSVAMNHVDGAGYSFKETAPFGRGVSGKAKVTVAKDRGGFIRQYAPAGVVGTLTLTSSGQDQMVSAALVAPSRNRLASRRVPART